MAAMDDFLASADPATSSIHLARQLEERGGIPVIVPTSTPSSTRSV